MIRTENLTKKFDDRTILDSVTINVEKGAVYGLVGPNGSGKTTLIKSLVGVYQIDSGLMTIDGEEVYENNQVKRRIAYISDDLYFPAGASLNSMAKFYGPLYPTFDWERFHKVASILDLDTQGRISKFSKGMKKQAEFCLSIAMKADVMVLDEPIDGLDPMVRKRIWSLILQDVAARQLTVIISSHNLRELEGICNYIGILDKGQLITEISVEDEVALTLEEMFIKEVGGERYELTEIIL